MLWKIIRKVGYEISLDVIFLLFHGLQMLVGLLLI